jgi:hypothetical protein
MRASYDSLLAMLTSTDFGGSQYQETTVFETLANNEKLMECALS